MLKVTQNQINLVGEAIKKKQTKATTNMEVEFSLNAWSGCDN